ncbi:DNA phosphorothioation-dependent restriction protein DptF [Bacillus cereus]|uniref:DNA phosphorothioation-dependent restriction protein DptF n=1 Tax=Bacillus cereus TaxID=1396 RepID=UPI000BF2FF4D|nr:DNA phosphorothioation-dependent restriction protein DptF [Bacillus cereus]MDR4440001.1 DNA phosphorothioation-dependent restriction protein DptF [Bacillus cereus]PEX05720.1 DNA phosphorothioation-dependent restriction protein DptF [Bacillus cereus]HDR7984040.1 DNA phosphorothioation-dependent restriction protein DptF [Bacillus cereus]
MENELLRLLLSLRASSRYSVVSEAESDKLQEKLYITTELDEYLEQALQKEGEEKWDLIVLGGNAGDGKSALIQKVCSKLTEEVLGKIKVNWDATHSDDPNENQQDILGSFFSPFLNEKKGTRPEKTHLIAMNTGMIVSFFEHARELKSVELDFTLLQKELYYYLDLVKEKEETGWRILLINLDQRNLLGFNQDEQSSIFKRMMDKLDIKNADGFLYDAFQRYKKNHNALDPIYFNLMALSMPKVQTQIERAVYKTVITYDLHFTPRAAWDLLYHLITSDDINIKGFQENEISKIIEKLFFQHMFSYSGDHDILKLMFHSDPCLLSTQALDSYVIQLSLQPQVENFGNIPFNKEILDAICENVEEGGKITTTEFALLAKRYSYFFNENDEIEASFKEKEQLYFNYEKLIQEYILYGMMSQFSMDIDSDLEQLQVLIENLRAAIVITFGESNKKNLFQVQELKNSGRFRVLTKLELPDENQMEPYIALKNPDPNYYRVIHFAPREVVIAFKDQNQQVLGELTVDFGLFELLEHIRKGYNPSSVDLNRFHHFKFFCNQLFTKLAESSSLNSVAIHDRIQDLYISVKSPQGLLKKKFEVERS